MINTTLSAPGKKHYKTTAPIESAFLCDYKTVSIQSFMSTSSAGLFK